MTMTKKEAWAAIDAMQAANCMIKFEVREVTCGYQGNVWIVDSRRGNTILRQMTAVPTADEAKAIVADMAKEMAARGKAAKTRMAGEKIANAS